MLEKVQTQSQCKSISRNKFLLWNELRIIRWNNSRTEQFSDSNFENICNLINTNFKEKHLTDNIGLFMVLKVYTPFITDTGVKQGCAWQVLVIRAHTWDSQPVYLRILMSYCYAWSWRFRKLQVQDWLG